MPQTVISGYPVGYAPPLGYTAPFMMDAAGVHPGLLATGVQQQGGSQPVLMAGPPGGYAHPAGAQPGLLATPTWQVKP